MKTTHFICGQNNKGETTTKCGLIAAKNGVIHVPENRATCKKCKPQKLYWYTWRNGSSYGYIKAKNMTNAAKKSNATHTW